MRKPESHQCPECGARRGPDGTPMCGCTRRASDTLRETRAAEAAAVEDFDPLRIRPYVDVDRAGTADRGEAAEDTAVTMPLRRVSGPSTTDLRLFDAGRDGAEGAAGADRAGRAAGAGGAPWGEEPRVRRRPRRTLLLAACVAGAAATVVAAAGLASGLFSYETPARDTAAPPDTRQSVPEATEGGASQPAPSAPARSPKPSSTSPKPSHSPSKSASPSTSPSVAPSSAPPSPTASPTQSRSATPTAAPDSPRPGFAPVLRPGDTGPDVTELQLRLRQLNLYRGPANGYYSGQVANAVSTYQWYRGIDSDNPGEYGPATRAGLESETWEP
ncbi:peptidoglycan-binding protein [Streptomyces sp. NPDC086787]|uniref:peptidoglycan-binding domain-containing protein n=1 Tax=Streptomyces sp. NPDC086787 TaxID=3365759 RepID=UPI0037F673FC